MKYIFRKIRYLYLAAAADTVGFFLLWLFSPKRPFSTRDLKKVLLIRMDHLGDVLLSTGTPKAIKENIPEAKLTFLTSSWAAPLLDQNPFIDEVLIFDAQWFLQKRYERKASSLGFWELVHLLKKRKFDLGIGLRGDARENQMMWLAGIRERIGYGVTGGGFFLTKEVHYRKRIHEKDRLVNLLRPLGIRGDLFKSRLYLSDRELVQADERLASLGLAKNDRLVGFQFGAGTLSKDWEEDLILDLLERFGKEFPSYRVILVGTRADQPGLERAAQMGHCVDLVRKTTLRELCALMTRLRFFIGPDSGPTHIAAALGIPSIFLFSGTNRFEEWRPLAEFATALRHPVKCSPCGLKVCNVPGHPCMSGIRPEDVLKVLRERLTEERAA